MKLITNHINKSYMESILPTNIDGVDHVFAAIAYGDNFNNTDNDFISHCLKHQYRLDIWMRYDHTVPVHIDLLKRLFRHQRDNIFCKLVPDRLHSKVIWWKGYGAYIGSANLTDRAWTSNIEVGVFLPDDMLINEGIDLQLEGFFSYLAQLDVAIPLSLEIINEQLTIKEMRKGIKFDTGKDRRLYKFWEGPLFNSSEPIFDKQKESFVKEWHETLGYLQSIREQLSDFRPAWISENTPMNWQVDQFLHAYYYNKLGEGAGRAKPFEQEYKKNCRNPAAVVEKTMIWWKSTSLPPSRENETLYEYAPTIQRLLSKENILKMSEDDLAKLCCYTHSTYDHLRKVGLDVLGRPELTSLSAKERIPLFAKTLLQRRNKKGWSVLQLLEFVLYGGSDNKLPERIFLAAKDPEYTIRHYGISSIAEVIGWALPEIAFPRNGRTNKALRAMGFDVKIDF
ncbi:MAG: phospholipase D family protein [Alistipes senegalensis]|nr:phospholipase D family protein [Oxalobacter formigenes]MCM1281906.1 phospholipase D family protein [Alistipes senegalensis]